MHFRFTWVWLGCPFLFVLENEKVPEDKLEDKQDDTEPCTLFNRHIPIDDQVCGDHTIPTRGRYLFVEPISTPVTGWIGEALASLVDSRRRSIRRRAQRKMDSCSWCVLCLPG